MKARIHHGAHEIGGNCVEVEHDGARLVLDVGRPLTAGYGVHVPLPDIAGLGEDGEEPVLGVLISHHHQDHWGLIDQVRAGLPIYMGAATERILRAAAFWTRGLEVPVAGHLEHRVPFQLGPFTVTPYLNDHSAFDAYSLLVEAGGHSLFYTGDIRGHGRKQGVFQQLLDDPPVGVDTLLLEGTNLQPGEPPKPIITESEVEDAMVETFAATDGMALVVTSAQNIDRLVSIYRATKRTGRRLVMDPYSADIARATGHETIPRPHPDWKLIHTYMPLWQRVRVKQAEAFDRLKGVDGIDTYRLFAERLAADPSSYVMLFSATDGPSLAKEGALDGATCTYSLWGGYLEEPSGKKLRAFLDANDIPLVHHHTSGHASVEDLGRLAGAIDATQVVPIHTFGADSYGDIVDNAVPKPDGEWWDVAPAPINEESTMEMSEGGVDLSDLPRLDVLRYRDEILRDGEDGVSHLLGDDVAWSLGVPQLHRILAEPDVRHWFPRVPQRGDAPEVAAAYYIPLVHMLLFRLGWVRPERGLYQWRSAGCPGGEPHLELLRGLWLAEVDLDPIQAWLASPLAHDRITSAFEVTGFVDDGEPGPLSEQWVEDVTRRATERAEAPSPVVGGSDPLHLSLHALAPIAEDPERKPDFLVYESKHPVGAVLLDTMHGWYRALHACEELLLYEAASASWPVEVLVRGVGSLGTYRRSPETGIRHATTERIHRWGVHPIDVDTLVVRF